MNSFTLKHYSGDVAVFLILTVILICVSAFAVKGSDENTGVSVVRDGKEITVLELSEDCVYRTDGITIKVENGKAYIYDSDCRDKICMSMHGVDKNGGGAVCIPNKLVLEPTGGTSHTDVTAG